METNRDYFSWSQYSLWKSSKLQFYKRYGLGEEGPRLPQFDKGKEFADFRETGELPHWVDDPLIETVNKAIPRVGQSELKLQPKWGEVSLLSYIDECQDDLKHFLEFKTGKIPWDQTKVNNHEQLDFYALCIYLHSGEKVIPSCELVWIETEETETAQGVELTYTGHVERFKREFTYDDMVNMATKLMVAWTEIKSWKFEELELDDDIVERYIDLLDQKKQIDHEIDLIKLQVMDELKSVGADYAVGGRGRFSLSRRKTPIYSTELINKETEYKNEIDKLKKAEKDSPNMEYTISESIRFTIKK